MHVALLSRRNACWTKPGRAITSGSYKGMVSSGDYAESGVSFTLQGIYVLEELTILASKFIIDKFASLTAKFFIFESEAIVSIEMLLLQALISFKSIFMELYLSVRMGKV